MRKWSTIRLNWIHTERFQVVFSMYKFKKKFLASPRRTLLILAGFMYFGFCPHPSHCHSSPNLCESSLAQWALVSGFASAQSSTDRTRCARFHSPPAQMDLDKFGNFPVDKTCWLDWIMGDHMIISAAIRLHLSARCCSKLFLPSYSNYFAEGT